MAEDLLRDKRFAGGTAESEDPAGVGGGWFRGLARRSATVNVSGIFGNLVLQPKTRRKDAACIHASNADECS